MDRKDMLARLLAQAEASGGDLVTLRAVVEEASDLGAERALSRLGLADDAAHADMAELRQLLAAWREAKAGVWKAAIEWLVKGALMLMLVGLAVRLGFQQWLR